MLIDNHIHIGWYSDGYHSPQSVWNAVRKAGIDKAVVSSTSTCLDLYHNILTELYQLSSFAGNDNIVPLLWLTPKMILNRWPIKMLLKSKIPWRGIKLHWLAHKWFFTHQEVAHEAIFLARQLGGLPVLIHTGDWDCCRAKIFEPLISGNPDLKFVLAHGRPIDQTIDLMKRYHNVWTDTAFMPLHDIKLLREEGLVSRTMFGSDIPINGLFYKAVTTADYLKARINETKAIAPVILENTVY